MSSLPCISCIACGSDSKKTPTLTVPQARRLIATVLPLRSPDKQGALDIVSYHIRRNFIAYRAHRKKSVLHATRMKADEVSL